MPCILDHDDCTGFEIDLRFLQHSCQPSNRVVGSRVVKTKQDNAHASAGRAGDDFAEIEIKRKNASTFSVGLAEYLAVGQPLKSLVSQMHDIVSGRPQMGRNSLRNAHVEEESHGPAHETGHTCS
ncbi:MAG: hypothetical protein U0836_12625 [Pirellulales bacterium]